MLTGPGKSNPHKVRNPETKKTIIQMLAAGKIQREVAAAVGVHPNTVAFAKKKFKDLIDIETERLIETLPDLTGRIIRDMKTYDKISQIMSGELDSSKLPKVFINPDGGINNALLTNFITVIHKSQNRIMESIGIFASHNQSTYIMNMIQNNKYETVNPSVLKAIGHHIQDITSDPDALPQEPVIPEVIPPEDEPEEEETSEGDLPASVLPDPDIAAP